MWKEQLVWAAFDKLHPIETFSMYFRRQGQVCVCVCLCSFFMATRVCVCVCSSWLPAKETTCGERGENPQRPLRKRELK